MPCQRRFRILMPEGALGRYVSLAPRTAHNIKAGCTMVIHERSGTRLTVHDTRLFPAEAAGVIPVADVPKRACLRISKGRSKICLPGSFLRLPLGDSQPAATRQCLRPE